MNPLLAICICVFIVALVLHRFYRFGYTSGHDEGRRFQTMEEFLNGLKDGTRLSIHHLHTKPDGFSPFGTSTFHVKTFDEYGYPAKDDKLVIHVSKSRKSGEFEFKNGRYTITRLPSGEIKLIKKEDSKKPSTC